MLQVTLAEVSAQLTQLVEAVQGEEIVITKDAQPVVKLSPLDPIPKRYPAKAGSTKGLIWNEVVTEHIHIIDAVEICISHHV